MFVPALFSTTRFRAVTRTPISVTSPTATAPVAVKVGGAAKRLSRNRTRLRGTVWPAAPAGRAILQRRSASGRWVFARAAGLRVLPGNRSRYSFKVTRAKRARYFRVKVSPRDGGAHYSASSRALRVPGR
jgi:hypothetical protein